jgi:hypothetical protein
MVLVFNDLERIGLAELYQSRAARAPDIGSRAPDIRLTSGGGFSIVPRLKAPE